VAFKCSRLGREKKTVQTDVAPLGWANPSHAN
jgi:hypothetical protein